jgi:hypothetical protein
MDTLEDAHAAFKGSASEATMLKTDFKAYPAAPKDLSERMDKLSNLPLASFIQGEVPPH